MNLALFHWQARSKTPDRVWDLTGTGFAIRLLLGSWPIYLSPPTPVVKNQNHLVECNLIKKRRPGSRHPWPGLSASSLSSGFFSSRKNSLNRCGAKAV